MLSMQSRSRLADVSQLGCIVFLRATCMCEITAENPHLFCQSKRIEHASMASIRWNFDSTQGWWAFYLKMYVITWHAGINIDIGLTVESQVLFFRGAKQLILTSLGTPQRPRSPSPVIDRLWPFVKTTQLVERKRPNGFAAYRGPLFIKKSRGVPSTDCLALRKLWLTHSPRSGPG